MKTNFSNSFSTKSDTKNSRGTPAFLKEKANVYKLKYFISKNDLSCSPRDFQCDCALRIWGRHTQQTIGCGQNHF